jgi:hypothetical protein
MRGGDATFDIAQGIPRNALEGMTIRSPVGRPVLAAPTGSYELDGPVDAPVAKGALAQGWGEAALQPDAASGGLRLLHA